MELSQSEINATRDDGLLRLEATISKTHHLSSSVCPVSVKGNELTVSDEDPLGHSFCVQGDLSCEGQKMV